MKKYLLLITLLLTTVSFSQIKFEANFESGNINTVTTTDSITFNVTTIPDIGGRWFYFRMVNVKNRFVRVNVSNSDVKRAMYSYDDKNYQRFTANESPSTRIFQKTYEHDTVYVSYYTPYNYSYLQERIQEWDQSPYVAVDTIGFTDRNFPMQEIRITDPSVADSLKERVWIHSRTHPGETPSSYHFDGIIQKLLEDDDVIKYYLQNVVFHCIPFTNPEGVYYGRSRTNFNGVDVESNWDKPLSQTTKEVQILKARMAEINAEKVLTVFNNLHSLASPKCTFFIHTIASTSHYLNRRKTQFSHLNTSDNPYFFPSDYSFSTLQPYFPEGWLFLNYGEVMAITYETPYDFYSNGIIVTNENLYEIGYRNVYAIAEFLQLSHPNHLLLDDKYALSFWNHDTTGTEFFGDGYLFTYSAYNAGPIEFQSEQISAGSYDVYSWWTASSTNASNTRYYINAGGNVQVVERNQKLNGAQWNKIGSINLQHPGNVAITISDSANGRIIADAFRLIRTGEPVRVDDIYMPADFVLYQNYPNPFNPSTTIRFNLQKQMHIKLRVFDALGRLITTLIDRELGEGRHEVFFDTGSMNLASGVYYYQLATPQSSVAKGMLLLK